MIPKPLITYIETAIIPRYKEFDKAHNLSHVRTVIEESLALARQYPEADERLAYVIAAYHDTGLCRDRATHHLVSGEILMADSTLRQWFSDTEILLMKEAVEDHRASTDHEPRSIYGKIVAEADRIIDPDITLRRTVQYGLKQNPAADKEWHYQRFHQHLMAKYAPGGYLKLWFPEGKNAEQLKKLQAIIADEGQLRQVSTNIRGGKDNSGINEAYAPFHFRLWKRFVSIMEQSVLYKETKCFYNGTNRFIPSKQVVSYKRNNLFRRGVTKCSVL